MPPEFPDVVGAAEVAYRGERSSRRFSRLGPRLSPRPEPVEGPRPELVEGPRPSERAAAWGFASGLRCVGCGLSSDARGAGRPASKPSTWRASILRLVSPLIPPE